jgi:hypothetical protein
MRTPRRLRVAAVLIGCACAVTAVGGAGYSAAGVTVLDKAGKVVERIGAKRPGLVLSPHGVAVNAQGDLFVSEFNLYGRVHKFNAGR